MYRIRRVKILIILAVFVAAACSDPGLLLPVAGDEPELLIQTVQKGSVLTLKDTFEIGLDYDSDAFQPDRLVVELLQEDGTVLFSQELGEDEILELPLPVSLPVDLEDGYYTVAISVFQEGESVSREESAFFYVSAGYTISGLTPYPQFFYPGGKGLVLADLLIPQEADPYLRWSSSDGILLAGLLSDGADALQLDVPDREGVYSLQLEVFPYGPGVTDEFSFQSSISLEAQFFVSKDQDEETAELYPDENYFSLFHFRGEHVDWGLHRAGKVADVIGDPEVALVDGIFGFRVDDNNGFSTDELLLPIVELEIEPFSFSMRYTPEQAEGEFFVVEQEDSAPLFSIGYGNDGILYAQVRDVKSTISDGPAAITGANELTVSIVPGTGSIRFLWFLNGFLMSDDTQTFEQVPIEGGGRSFIGGTGGFSGIIDEIGVFYRVTERGVEVDDEVYARAMERQHGEQLVYAEGFDGLTLADQISYTGSEEGVSVDGGSLFLANGSGIELPPMGTDFDTLSIFLELSAGAGSLTLLISGEEFKLADVGPDNALILSDGAIVETEFIDLEVRDGALRVGAGDKWLVVTPFVDSDESVVLSVANLLEDAVTELKSILILNNHIPTEEGT